MKPPANVISLADYRMRRLPSAPAEPNRTRTCRYCGLVGCFLVLEDGRWWFHEPDGRLHRCTRYGG